MRAFDKSSVFSSPKFRISKGSDDSRFAACLKKIEEPQIVQRPIGPLQLEVACGKRRCSCVDIHVPVLVCMLKACLILQPCSIRIKLSFSREL